jgi:hypothetical protein
MYKLIRELAEQCHHRYSEHNIDLEKFAELILRECISKAEDYGLGCDAVEQLKADFGVE